MEKTLNSTVSAINLVEVSHHDLGWHKCSYAAEAAFTFQEINNALDLMQKDPAFTWTHECGGYLYRYLEAFPERKNELKQRVAEGRFDIGAGYTMPYTSFVTSEMLVRQFIYGKKWVESVFPGYHSDIYYNTDIPGLGVQMPQIMKKAGVRYLYAARSWNFDGYRQNEFKQMESLDHSKINVFFMNHYSNSIWSDEHGPFTENVSFIKDKIHMHETDIKDKNVGDQLPLYYSMDCILPYDFTERFRKWNTYAETYNLPKMKYTTLTEALDAVFTEDADLSHDILKGEWPSKWFYENSGSDDHTFMKEREAERFLRTAETLAVLRAIATGNFDAYPVKELEEAWRAADHSCHGYAPEGSIRDFKEVYQKAFDIAQKICRENLLWLVNAVHTDPAKGDISFVVYNNLSWVRDDIVIMEKPEGAGDTFRIVDADGKEAMYQFSDDGKIVMFAEKVPSMGYKVYYIRTEEAPVAAGECYTVNAAWTGAFSNAYYTVVPVAEGGALASVVDKENADKSLFATEKFKIGELYDFHYNGMGAGEQLNMWQPHGGVAQTRNFAPWVCVESGPVRTVFETRAEKMSRGSAAIRFTLYDVLKRADFDVSLDIDSEAARQLRLMFPVNAGGMFDPDGMIDHSNTRVTYEVPFGAVNIGDEVIQKFSRFNTNTGDPNNVGGSQTNCKDLEYNSAVRPREVQNWVEASDADQDMSVVISSYNMGWDYQDATPKPVQTPVLQPIMISTSKACHWEYGHWLQPGKHAFRFSMTSGTAGCKAGHKMAVGVNNPLMAEVQTASSGLLPETTDGITVNHDNVVITAVKKAEDDMHHVIVRWYETEGCGCAKDVVITLPGAEAIGMQKTNLIERPEADGSFRVVNGAVRGPVAPWSIETAMITLKNL